MADVLPQFRWFAWTLWRSVLFLLAIFSSSAAISVIDSNPRRHYQSPMINIASLTAAQLHRVIAIKEQIEALQAQIDSIANRGGGEIPIPTTIKAPKKRRMTAAGRARIAAAARARWARIKGTKVEAAPKKRRKMGAAWKAKLAAAARARWAKAKAAGKTRL
jgi:hypothetical protein